MVIVPRNRLTREGVGGNASYSTYPSLTPGQLPILSVDVQFFRQIFSRVDGRNQGAAGERGHS